jgi:hypothetical protein
MSLVGTTTVVSHESGELQRIIRFIPYAFMGHCVYVRKCMTGMVGKDGKREINGIAIPDNTAEEGLSKRGAFNQYWVEVVAKGPNIGLPVNRFYRQKYNLDRSLSSIVFHVEHGDMLLIPEKHPGIKRSPWNWFEAFIEESVPLMVLHIDKQGVA